MERLIVDTQGHRLYKDGERMIIRHEGQQVGEAPLGSLDQLVLMGRGVGASTPLLYELVRRGVDVIYQSQSGRFGFRLVGPVPKHSALRVQQILTVMDPTQALPLARAVVAGKLHNQAVVLRHYGDALGDRGRHAVRVIVEQMEKAARADSVDSLRGYEGSGAAAYFGVWPRLFDSKTWDFEGRAYHPPPDPVNAMLSFGYTLLLNDVISALYGIGLDPDVGFFHALDYGRPSLALDLQEEFRPVVVDRLVLRLVRGADLKPEIDFQQVAGQAGSRMTDDVRRLFLAEYDEQMGIKVRYHPLGQLLSYRQCLEKQAEHLARCIQGQQQAYGPLLIR